MADSFTGAIEGEIIRGRVGNATPDFGIGGGNTAGSMIGEDGRHSSILPTQVWPHKPPMSFGCGLIKVLTTKLTLSAMPVSSG